MQYDRHLYRDIKICLNVGGFICAVDLLLWNARGFVLIWQVFLVLIGTQIIVQNNFVYLK